MVLQHSLLMVYINTTIIQVEKSLANVIQGMKFVIIGSALQMDIDTLLEKKETESSLLQCPLQRIEAKCGPNSERLIQILRKIQKSLLNLLQSLLNRLQQTTLRMLRGTELIFQNTTVLILIYQNMTL